MLLMILLTPCCMSKLMVNVHTCSTHNSTYTRITKPDLMMNVRTCVTATTTYTMSYLSQLSLFAVSGVQRILCCVCVLFFIGVCILSANFSYYRSTLVEQGTYTYHSYVSSDNSCRPNCYVEAPNQILSSVNVISFQ